MGWDVPAVVLTGTVCWGHSEHGGLCWPRCQSRLWELCEVGRVGGSWAANKLLVGSSPLQPSSACCCCREPEKALLYRG